MQAIVSRLEAWLAANHPEPLAQPAPGISDEEIVATEGRLGVRLPDGLRALYEWRNGTGPIMGDRSLLPLADAAGLREQMARACDERNLAQTHWHRSWVPFLTDGNGSYLVWDPNGSFEGEPGQILEFWKDDSERNIVAPSFDDWLAAFVDSLEAGIWSLEDGVLTDDPGFEKFVSKRIPGYPRKPIKRDGKRAKPTKKVHGPRMDKSSVAADLSKPVRQYRASEQFSPGERVNHPTFGEGVVELLPEPSKIQVFFKTGRKVLVHAGSKGEALKRPAPFDYTKVKPPT